MSSRPSTKKLLFAADGDYYRDPELVKSSYRLGGAPVQLLPLQLNPTPRAQGRLSEEQAERVYRMNTCWQTVSPRHERKKIHLRNLKSRGCQNKSSIMWAAAGTSTWTEEIPESQPQKKSLRRSMTAEKGGLVVSRDELLSRWQVSSAHARMSNTEWIQ